MSQHHPNESRVDPRSVDVFVAPAAGSGRVEPGQPRRTTAPELVISLSRTGRSVRLFTGLGEADYHPLPRSVGVGLEHHRDH